MRAAGAIAFGTVLSLLAFASCGGKTEVTIELLDPCKSEGASFRAAADYVEFAVFPSKCPDDTLLAAGLTGSARYRKVVKSAAGLPEVGDLPKEKFGFAAVLRDENCGVIGFGCTNADLENTKKIIVAVRAWATPAGKNDPSEYCTPLTGGGCPPSTVCSSGNCKKVNEDDAGGCTLAVAAGGKLPAPVVEGASVSGPAITATDSGFVMAYRDQDPTSGFPRVIVYYVSDEGVPAANPGKFDLTVGCPEKTPTDGVGAIYGNGLGLIATSIPNCDPTKGAGAVFLPFDDMGLVSGASAPQNALFNDLTLGPISSVALGAAEGDFDVVFRSVTTTPAIERAVWSGSQFKPGVNIVHPFGEGDFPFGLIATSTQVRAFLAPMGANTQVLIGTKLGDALDSAPSTLTFDSVGSWAALTAWSNRVAAAVPASSGISLKVGQLSSSGGEAGSPEIFSGTVGSTAATGGALAVLRSHLFVASARSGGVTMHNLEGAEGTIKLPISAPAPTEGGTEGGASSGTGSIDLQTNLGDATLANFSGTQIAMAAARNRVAIVWLTKPKLTAADPTGGWALLRCNE